MKHSHACLCGVAALLATLAISTSAARSQGNSVVVESKSVEPGQTDVEVGVYISNAVKIIAIVLPFEIRSVDPSNAPHSFTSGPATLNLNPAGRVYSSPLGPNSPSGIPASTSKRWYHQPGGPPCSGPASGTYAVQDTTPDNVSPDGCMLFSNSYQSDIGDDIDLDPGTETPGTDVPSILLQFDVNSVHGRFLIDTCCVRPANHLAFQELNTALVIPSFTKGTITVGTPPDNSVVVESKEVIPGQTNVTVGVYISNAVDISAIVLPFEFRTVGSAVGPHAFTQGPVSLGWNPNGRADASALGANSVFGFPAWISNQRYPDTGGTICSGPISGTYLTADGTLDNLSPDGSSFIALAMGCGEACDDYASNVMFAGQEVPGVDDPSFLIQFNVNNVQGQLEIDTCCVRPANHLYFIDRNTATVPGVEFTKGIITVGTPLENSVVVESKEILPGATDVRIGIYISNVDEIVGLTLPLEIRSIDSGAFYVPPLTRGFTPGARLDEQPLGPHAQGAYPGYIVERLYAAPVGLICSGPASSSYSTATVQSDGHSPDGLLLTAEATDGGVPNDLTTDPGLEIVGETDPSYYLLLNVTGVVGQFEIDTCCVGPSFHLAFYDYLNNKYLPTFTKGIISIGCFCRCHGDPDCNGYLDIVDVVRTINTAFRGSPSIADQDCTHARTDVDANAMTNVLDVARMIDVVFGGQDEQSVFVDPCAE